MASSGPGGTPKRCWMDAKSAVLDCLSAPARRAAALREKLIERHEVVMLAVTGLPAAPHPRDLRMLAPSGTPQGRDSSFITTCAIVPSLTSIPIAPPDTCNRLPPVTAAGDTSILISPFPSTPPRHWHK